MDRKDKIFICLLLVAAVIPRIVYFSGLIQFPLANVPVLDSEYYFDWAKKILSGDIFSRDMGVLYLSPGYPYFLSVLFFLFRASVIPVYLAQFILGAGSCVLLYFIMRKYFGVYASFMASLLAAVYNVSFFIEGLILTNSLIVFLNILALFLIHYLLKDNLRQVKDLSLPGRLLDLQLQNIKISRFPGDKLFFIPGVFIGLSALFRPNVMIFPLLLCLALLCRKKMVSALFFTAGIFLVIFPFALRNRILGGEWEFFAATGGMNFYIGNNINSNGTYQDFSFDMGSPFNQGENYRKKASELSGRELKKGEADRYWLKRTLSEIKDNPKRYFFLMRHKMKLFWHYYEIPMNFSFDFFRKRVRFFGWKIFPGSGILFPIILTGLLMALIFDFRRMLIPLCYSAGYFIAITLFFVSSEYRYPAIFPSFIFIGWVFNEIELRSKKAEKLQGKIFRITVFCLVSVFSVWVTAFPRMKINNFGRERVKLGIALVETGKAKEGISEIKEAEKEISESSTNYNLAKIYLTKLNDKKNAAIELEKAVRREPNPELKTRYIKELAEILIEEKRYDEALGYYLEGLRINEKNHSFYQFAGNIYYLQKDMKNCVLFWKKSLEIFPDNPDLKRNLSVLYNR